MSVFTTLFRNACLGAAVRVTGPRFRQVQLSVDQCAPCTGSVGEEHSELGSSPHGRRCRSIAAAHRRT